MKLLVYSSGYGTTPWHNDKQEIGYVLHPKCGGVTNKKWSPWNKDFAAIGKQSGGGQPAANIAELLDIISKQGVETIEELRILGHSNSDAFSLGGKVVDDDVLFEDRAAVIADIAEFTAVMPKCRELQDRFQANAKIILMGCNGGSGKENILKQVSQAFLRKAYGYKEKILFNFKWEPVGQAVKEQGALVCYKIGQLSAITLRGRLLYIPPVDETDIFAKKVDPNDTSLYAFDAWGIGPDASNDSGDLLACCRRKDAANGASELVWRILSTCFPGHAWVSGTAVEPNLQGLKVTKDGTKMCIVVGPWFASNSSPRTLQKRIDEVKEALVLVAAKKEGTVAPK